MGADLPDRDFVNDPVERTQRAAVSVEPQRVGLLVGDTTLHTPAQVHEGDTLLVESPAGRSTFTWISFTSDGGGSERTADLRGTATSGHWHVHAPVVRPASAAGS